MNKIPTICLILMLVTIGAIAGCSDSVCSGNAKSGYAHFPKDNLITPEKAVELARPYLDLSYEMRRSNRKDVYNKMSESPLEYVILKGDYYYVTKDNYPSNVVTFYMEHAVRVNKKTGKVHKP
jgi:hypothetical protein